MKTEFISNRNILQNINTNKYIAIKDNSGIETGGKLPEILFITTYPPRECGIATYSHDLVKALNNKFNKSFKINICALESASEQHIYPDEVTMVLNTDLPTSYGLLAKKINGDSNLKIVLIQHEFGLFAQKEVDFRFFLHSITKPIIFVFHTVLPRPDEILKAKVQEMAAIAESIIVMTQSSQQILATDYGVPRFKTSVIAHGTHLVNHIDKGLLKQKYGYEGRKILSTFGLLSSGKSIETTLDALPAIVSAHPEVLFLIMGKTHPSVVKHEGEQYRQMLKAKVDELHLVHNVQFINRFIPLPSLLEYLQLSDIYLFTSKDPNQAVSGTFSYAISCGCPIISTPIPHAREVMGNDTGIIVGFQQPGELAEAVNRLLGDSYYRENIRVNCLQRMAPTAWENAATAHAILFEKMSHGGLELHYKSPEINLGHLKKMTTGKGIIQFSKINQPDISSGYTLDDNARALIAMCQHYELTNDTADIAAITTYFNFIKYCAQPGGSFLNYVDDAGHFTPQNRETNLEDANGRAIWALGYLSSMNGLLPDRLTMEAEALMKNSLLCVKDFHSTRAIAFIIKGLYYSNSKHSNWDEVVLIKTLASRLVQMYRHEATEDWNWYESYLTYANSILPEALLCAWLATGEKTYRDIAKNTFTFLLSKTFSKNKIQVISNRNWLKKGDKAPTIRGGEQPIDVAYTIIALSKFYSVFGDEDYKEKMETAFNWFLGSNHLHQIIYNPCTGGCYDGIEEINVNLNQGAESTVSYLMARLAIEKITIQEQKLIVNSKFYGAYSV